MGDEALTAGAAARRLGVAVTTLRTWHQRYGLGPSRHEPGHHRRYTREDMDRLQVMQRLTAQGVAPAEAAAWARGAPSGRVSSPDPAPGQGGGQVIALGQADASARGLARAAMRLDAPAMRGLLGTAVADRGVVGAWTEVIMPVLIGIGERYAATGRFIEVEHLLSRTVTEALAAVPVAGSDWNGPSSGVFGGLGSSPLVLLAAADEEQHTLPLEALGAALAEAGVPSRLFGARLPPEALLDAVDRTGPAVVVVWSQLPATGAVDQLTRLRAVPRPPVVVAAAGPGWPPDDLPPGVTRLSSLPEAARLVTTAATSRST
ncbi:MerR family transcriptional regulator [Actinoplanes sp. NPDC051851]|uniref:MerR family transcriptional regulator n=1 Tax=Actinoplanes sp. NPDC051851 TaxID=3154753 RepID=UPI003422DCF1